MPLTRRELIACMLLRPSGKLKITAVELSQLTGHRDAEQGINGQYQVNPLYVYDDYRPAVYADKSARTKSIPITQIYVKIRTDAGLDGLYGPIDREAAIAVQEQLRPFLIGKDPARRRSPVGPDVPLEPPLPRGHISHGHQRRRQRPLGPPRPLL